jgi:hypothetical protein
MSGSHMHPIRKSCTHGLLTKIGFVQMINDRLIHGPLCTVIQSTDMRTGVGWLRLEKYFGWKFQWRPIRDFIFMQTEKFKLNIFSTIFICHIVLTLYSCTGQSADYWSCVQLYRVGWALTAADWAGQHVHVQPHGTPWTPYNPLTPYGPSWPPKGSNQLRWKYPCPPPTPYEPFRPPKGFSL